MKIAHSMKMFAGSVAVYVAVASAYACGEASQPARPGRPGTAASSGGDGGASGASGASGADVASGSASDSVGAGPVSPAMADPVPGTRLRSQYRVADDGSSQWFRWFDTAFDAPCFWYPMSDGRTRCIPVYASGIGYYGDAECVRSVFRPSCDRPDIRRGLMVEATGQCGLTARVFDVEPLPTASKLYARSGATCVELTGNGSMPGDLIATSEISPAEFVGSEIADAP